MENREHKSTTAIRNPIVRQNERPTLRQLGASREAALKEVRRMMEVAFESRIAYNAARADSLHVVAQLLEEEALEDFEEETTDIQLTLEDVDVIVKAVR